MTIASAGDDEFSPWWWASSALKQELAMDAAVTGGFSGISGVMALRGDRSDEGDMRFTELARRGGATPLAECRELREAFRRRVGVAERESRPFGVEEPFRGLRGAPRKLATLGERLSEGLTEVEEGRGDERGDRTGDDVASDSCLRESESSDSASRSLLFVVLFTDCLRRGDAVDERLENEAMLRSALPPRDSAGAALWYAA